MVILFDDNKLAKICNSSKELNRKYGSISGNKILQRLSELNACDSLADMKHIPGARCHELHENRKGQFAVDLKHPRRLIFKPSNPENCRKADGGLNWALIEEITIIEIADYHGN